MHAPYSFFIEQATLYNGGKEKGLLRGAGTRFANWFYAMHRLLQQHNALLATIHQEKFRSMAVTRTNERVRGCVLDIEDPSFWKAIYTILRAVFPALRALRYCDSNTPAMDKIYMLAQRTSDAIDKSVEVLNDPALLRSFTPEGDDLNVELIEIYGAEVLAR